MAKGKSSIAGIFKILFLWIFLLPLIWLGYPTVLMMTLGMLPTLVSWLMERDFGNPRTLSIGVFNMCGVIPYLIELWEHYQSLKYAMQIFMDVNSWFMMYGTAFVGYTIYWGVPKIVLGAMRITARKRIRYLKQAQGVLLKEWGNQIKPENRDAAIKERSLEPPKKEKKEEKEEKGKTKTMKGRQKIRG